MTVSIDKLAPEIVRPAATLLTGSFVNSQGINVEKRTVIGVEILYTPGTGGTGVEIKPLVRALDATDAEWVPAEVKAVYASPSGGEVRATFDAVIYQHAGTTAIMFHVPINAGQEFCVAARELGGPSAFGTCRVRLFAVRA